MLHRVDEKAGRKKRKKCVNLPLVKACHKRPRNISTAIGLAHSNQWMDAHIIVVLKEIVQAKIQVLYAFIHHNVVQKPV